MELILLFILALALDLVLGEPPIFIHPVVWMGKVISFIIKWGVGRGPRIQFVFGCMVVLFTIALFVTPVYFLIFYLKGINAVLYVIISAALLKTTFSLIELRRAALIVKNSLLADSKDNARFELRALVGRDTSNLDNGLMVSAAIESVAENSCDSFVAPLFYFLFLGVAGAVAYRVINTFDAMIGYHGEFEYLGKFAARLDSAANFIPARITALLIVLASWIMKKNTCMAWRIMLRDRSKTESPNAGWTMSAIAGALNVRLEKTGYYTLGDNNSSLTLSKIDDSLQIIMVAAFAWSVLLVLLEVVCHVAA